MSEFFTSIGIDIGIFILLLTVLVLILIVLLLNVSLSMHRLRRKYNLFMKGTDGQSLERAFAQKFKEVERLADENERNYAELQALKKCMTTTLTKYGIEKYDAFDDVGGKLSFALAMLDRYNTGFILNVIHNRDNCFFYIKEIVKGESYILLSSEEMNALRKAVHFNEEEI